jgi:hypothetical protein
MKIKKFYTKIIFYSISFKLIPILKKRKQIYLTFLPKIKIKFKKKSYIF